MAEQIQVVKPTEALVAELAGSMRAGDRAEVYALGMSPQRALEHSLDRSHAAGAVLFDGQVAAIYGLVQLDGPTVAGSKRALVWLLTSTVVDAHPLSFWRLSKQMVRALRGEFDVIFNDVDARYFSAVRWLRALGFSLSPARPHGPHRVPFHFAALEGGPGRRIVNAPGIVALRS
jgi:hypothetical protein